MAFETLKEFGVVVPEHCETCNCGALGSCETRALSSVDTVKKAGYDMRYEEGGVVLQITETRISNHDGPCAVEGRNGVVAAKLAAERVIRRCSPEQQVRDEDNCASNARLVM